MSDNKKTNLLDLRKLPDLNHKKDIKKATPDVYEVLDDIVVKDKEMIGNIQVKKGELLIRMDDNPYLYSNGIAIIPYKVLSVNEDFFQPAKIVRE